MSPSFEIAKETGQAPKRRTSTDGRDILIVGTTLAAILLFVGTGTAWLHSMFGTDVMLQTGLPIITSTLLLNIAIVLIGWRRYRQLQQELQRRINAENEARHLAARDGLTGMLNRRAAGELIQSQAAAWSKAGANLAALVIDIDSFKNINDLFGHASGDDVITETARRIEATVPRSAIIARLGGDEFAVLLPVQPDDFALIDDIGETLTTRLAEPLIVDGVEVATSSSIGGAIMPASAPLDMLLRHADTAMYRAKHMGRRRYCRFDGDMETALARRDDVEAALRAALLREELYPVYEPLVDLTTGEAIGYEMLARWVSPTLGEISPSEFIPIAEENGLIAPLSELLFRRAFTEAREWPDHLNLSVNVSPLQLRDPWFSQKLIKLLAETNFPTRRLIVEITESAIIDNLALARGVFISLQNQGIRIALDDFGTGHSSIASLRSLPFDSVKIDREYIARLSESASADSLAEAVLQLGHSLGLPVVAEGIETLGTAERLSQLSCQVGQGYFYGKGISGDEVMQRHTPGNNAARRHGS